MLTRRARELAESWGQPIREEELYGVAGSGFYDLITRQDRSEVREVINVARRVSGDIVDLGCGSGRLTIPLLSLGRRVVGVDLAGEMLRILRERSESQSLPGQLEAVEQDMSSYDPPDPFGLSVIGATSISLLDQARRSQVFANARGYLAAEGRLILTATEEYDDKVYESGRQTALSDSGDELAYHFFQEVDAERGVRNVNFAIEPSGNGNSEVRVFSSSVNLVSLASLEPELRAEGFAITSLTPVRTRSVDQRGLMLVECACST